MTTADTLEHTRQVKNAFTNNGWYLSGYEANIRIRSETVSAFLDEEIPRRVADLGCGDGSLSLGFLERGSSVTFLDLSEAMLQCVSAKIAEKDKARAAFLNTDFLGADLPAGAFDLVIFVGVMAYLDDLDAVVARLRSILKPGGRLILEYTDASHLLAQLNFAYRGLTARLRAPKCTTYRHKKGEVDAALKKGGFKAAASFRYVYTMPLFLRLFSQEKRYRYIKALFGNAKQPRRQWLGSEDLTLYQLVPPVR
jgi:SAM-dependent methyltransferase